MFIRYEALPQESLELIFRQLPPATAPRGVAFGDQPGG